MYVEPNINKMPYTKGVNFLMLWKSKKKGKKKVGTCKTFSDHNSKNVLL